LPPPLPPAPSNCSNPYREPHENSFSASVHPVHSRPGGFRLPPSASRVRADVPVLVLNSHLAPPSTLPSPPRPEIPTLFPPPAKISSRRQSVLAECSAATVNSKRKRWFRQRGLSRPSAVLFVARLHRSATLLDRQARHSQHRHVRQRPVGPRRQLWQAAAFLRRQFPSARARSNPGPAPRSSATVQIKVPPRAFLYGRSEAGVSAQAKRPNPPSASIHTMRGCGLAGVLAVALSPRSRYPISATTPSPKTSRLGFLLQTSPQPQCTHQPHVRSTPPTSASLPNGDVLPTGVCRRSHPLFRALGIDLKEVTRIVQISPLS